MEVIFAENVGENVSFQVFGFSIHPGIEIDYITEDSRRSEGCVKTKRINMTKNGKIFKEKRTNFSIRDMCCVRGANPDR